MKQHQEDKEIYSFILQLIFEILDNSTSVNNQTNEDKIKFGVKRVQIEEDSEINGEEECGNINHRLESNNNERRWKRSENGTRSEGSARGSSERHGRTNEEEF